MPCIPGIKSTYYLSTLKRFFSPKQVACPQTSPRLLLYIQSLRLLPNAAVEHKLQPPHAIHVSCGLHRPSLPPGLWLFPCPQLSQTSPSQPQVTPARKQPLLTNHLHSLCSPGTNASVSSQVLQQITSDELPPLPALFSSGSSVTSPPDFFFPT